MLACPVEEPKTAASIAKLALAPITGALATDFSFAAPAPETNVIDKATRVAHRQSEMRTREFEGEWL